MAKAITFSELLDQKYVEAKNLQTAYTQLLNTPPNYQNTETFEKYREQLSLASDSQKRIKAEIEVLEKIDTQRLRKSLSTISWSDAKDILSSLSKIPADPYSIHAPHYFIDLNFVATQRNWVTGFPQFLKSYLSFSSPIQPKAPVSYLNSIQFEAKEQLVLRKHEQKSTPPLRKKLPREDIAELPTSLPSISFPKVNQENTNTWLEEPKEIKLEDEFMPAQSELSIQIRTKGYELKAPKLKKVRKAKN